METPTLDRTQVPADRIERAMYFVELGFGVYPTKQHLKRPIVKEWQHKALTTPREVEEHYGELSKRADNMILTLPNHAVLDVDPKNGGVASLARLQAQYGELPLTRVHFTASGEDSEHYVFQRDPNRPLKNKPLDPVRFPGIDIKTGYNALIVAPGSEVDGRFYGIKSEAPCVALPEFVYEIREAADERKRKVYAAAGYDPRKKGASPTKAVEALRSIPADSPERGNDWLCELAGHLAHVHADYDPYHDALKEIDRESIDPHEPDRFERTAESIWNREQNKAKESRPMNPKTQLVATKVQDTDDIETEGVELGGGYDASHIGWANRFRDQYGENIRYIPGRGWFGWDGRKWVEDVSVVVREYHRMSSAILAEAETIEDDAAKAKAKSFVRSMRNTRNIRGVLEQASHLDGIRVHSSKLDADPNLFMARNGVVDLTAGKLIDNSRDFLITKSGHVDFDPDAECPKFLEFLRWCLAKGDKNADGKHRERGPEEIEEGVKFLQQMFGDMLIGHNDGQRVYFIYGPGGNGKSQLIDVGSACLGSYFVQALPDLLTKQAAATHSEAEANLAGARMVAISETAKGQRLDESRLKRLSGDKMQRASFKGEKAFEFPTTFTLVMYGNHYPTLPFDEGIKRRVKVLGMFNKKPIAEQVKNLASRLIMAEGPGILAWMVEGAARVLAGNDAYDPPVVKEGTAGWQKANSGVAEFIEECLVFHPEFKATNREVWLQYEVYVNSGGYEAVHNKKELSDRILEWTEAKGLDFVIKPNRPERTADSSLQRGFRGFRVRMESVDYAKFNKQSGIELD
ncbi:phage/plasmid primase, P4 family [Streptomyces chryseus]